ncbi:hypothetical protein GQR42_04890 [Microcystis aeruginosa FD4]|uniref:Uncharacterized protein n=1 Tax=Microcystis aeruginosa FD4 TaxID=2686288 RepID=A0A857D0M8_MICAE|nr:hypothetical protein GQR42_04890 [Microcystis aeruginosa FD4]
MSVSAQLFCFCTTATIEAVWFLGTCALIMYLLGERSSPLHCGQNPLLSGRLEPAPSARRGFADHPK